MPKLTAENYKVSIIRFADYNSSNFDYVQIVKMALMVFDARFAMFDDNDKKLASGECFIIDGSGVSFRHFLKVVKNVTTLRLYMRFLQEAEPCKYFFMIFSFRLLDFYEKNQKISCFK